MKKSLKLYAALLCVASLNCCTSLASFVASTATEMSSSTPGQVKTIAEATQAATLLTNTVDLYVKNGNPNKSTLLEIQKLSDGVHSALTVLQNASAANQSVAMASFNAALQAFQAYATNQGISH